MDQEKRINELTEEVESLKRQLAITASLKYHLMPDAYPFFSDISEIDIYADQISLAKVGGDFFDIFPADFEMGNADVLSDISNVIVSRSFANRLGGPEQAIGQTLDGAFTIAAIVKETPNPLFGDVDIISNIENLTNRKKSPFMLDVIPFVKVYCFNNRIMAIFVANMISDLELWSRRFFPKTFHPDANLKHQPTDSQVEVFADKCFIPVTAESWCSKHG